MNNFLLIEPTSGWPSVYGRAVIPRVGCYRIAAEVERHYRNTIFYSEALSGPIENNWSLVREADEIGFSIITPFALDAYDIIGKIREEFGNTKRILAGGPHPTFCADEVLGRGVDVVFRGPASMTFRRFLGEGQNCGIDGISYRNSSGEIFHNPDAPKKEDLNDLPPPAFNTLWNKGKKLPLGFSGAIETRRSCPHKCDFCSVWPMLGPVTSASPETVIRDMQAMQESFGHCEFLAVDDNFGASRTHALAVCDEINRAITDGNLKDCFGMVQASTKVPLDDEFLQALYPVLRSVALGVEDLKENSYKKRGTLAEVEICLTTLSKAGFHTHAMMIVQPDNSWREIKATIYALRKMGVKSAQFTSLTPFPGAPFWNRLAKEGKFSSGDINWRDFNTFHGVGAFEPDIEKEMEDIMNYAWIKFHALRYMPEKVFDFLRVGETFQRSRRRALVSFAILIEGLRWARQDRGRKGLMKALINSV